MPHLSLDTPLSQLTSVTPRFAAALKRLGLETVRDALWHFPSRYDDFSHVTSIADIAEGQQATIRGVVQDIKARRSFKRWMTIIEAEIEDESGETIRAVWFNQPYLPTILKVGTLANFAGKVTSSERGAYLAHPAWEVLSRNKQQETRDTGRLVPVYPETRGITSRALRFLVAPILAHINDLPDPLPEGVREAHNLPDLSRALRDVHFPENLGAAITAKRRFAFEDLLLLHLFNIQQKQALAKEKAPSLPMDVERLKTIVSSLPFELTSSQKKALWEIMQDLEKPVPMNRLLQGDVGSGKTVVALIAALAAAENGFQTAFMAPTEVLARQHFSTIHALLSKMAEHIEDVQSWFPVGLLTGEGAHLAFDAGEKELTKAKFKAEAAAGNVRIVVGTHALIQKSASFKNLGLVVIDEQHRFGVRQRAQLAKNHGLRIKNYEHEDTSVKFLIHNSSFLIPHFLSMSATPIPRTLMLTIFGDLDISTITELPKGRKNIITKVVAPENRLKAYGFIRGHIKKGRQVFVICPRIDTDPKNPNVSELPERNRRTFGSFGSNSDISDRIRSAWEVKAVKEEYEKLSKKIFPDLCLAMLHGKLRAKEKAGVMEKFRRGQTDILVSTSVIEVGVDVPNANIMMIEGAERFGLAQLYQLRGRVGRGAHQSFCFLFTDSDAGATNKRLEAIVDAKNGFELAELDLKLRGPGQFLSEEQSGFHDLTTKALRDTALTHESRDAARELIAQNASLDAYPLLKEQLEQFRKSIHLE
jgi:ATP-dependent DNA helicase RecG